MTNIQQSYKIQIFKGKDDQYYWRITHSNGNILLTSEGYKNKSDAIGISENFFEKFSILTASWEILD